MKLKYGIKQKIFLIIAFVLFLNLIITLFLGSQMFEELYTYSKNIELDKGVDIVKQAYSSNNYSGIENLENKNIIITVYEKNNSGVNIIYSTRRSGREFPLSQEFNINSHLFSKPRKDFSPDSLLRNEGPKGFLRKLTPVNDTVYILLETPIDNIKMTAQLAFRYVVIISIITFMIAIVIIYFIANKITKPVKQVQEIADAIATFDFSKHCDEKGNDEIAMLAKSINTMSSNIQAQMSGLILANEKLKDDLYKQEQADKLRKSFIANVSHDFKTPITLISSYAQAIEQMKGTDELTAEYCQVISGEADKMTKLIKLMLDLSRFENGSIAANISFFVLEDLIYSSVERYKIKLDAKNINIHFDLNTEIITEGDYQLIESAFSNLIDNAVKYTPDKGKIVVKTEQIGEKCRVSVFNSGTNVAEEDTEKLFLSFYRGDKSRNLESNSFGLGLAMVKSIMELHGQTYGVLNKDDGVEFWFNLNISKIEN